MNEITGTESGDGVREREPETDVGDGYRGRDRDRDRNRISGSPDGAETEAQLFDHERLDVYRVAREFLVLANGIDLKKMPRDFREQFDRATVSILANIGEGAGKTARPDKQRFYEIARGSACETAALLDMIQIRGAIDTDRYMQVRHPLFRVVQMLSRLCADPRNTR
jgi:four helix bundle protein